MYTYTNSFHNTEARSKYSAEEMGAAVFKKEQGRSMDGYGIVAEKAARRIRLKLCPSHKSGCTCGDWLGRR